ncbi:uncharacterized protein TNCV_1459251 [Trichonephila clavipes]|nr:uncharacterized protein TNCV_1459251 [Trichonephila clavipes]
MPQVRRDLYQHVSDFDKDRIEAYRDRGLSYPSIAALALRDPTDYNGTHTITPAVGVVCRCKAKAGLRRSKRRLHTRTRLSSLLKLNLDSSLKTTWFYFAAVLFPHARHHSKRRSRWVGVKGSTCNGRRDSKCPSNRRLRMVREDTGAPCAWITTDEAGGCTRAFLTMWLSSRRLVCRGRSQPGLRVNDISRIHWSQHLLSTQPERPN